MINLIDMALIDWKLMKQNKQLDFLVESARAGKGAHAYLFFGGTRQEKKDTAVAFALELTG